MSNPLLTSLSRARAWAGVTSSNDDTLITSLITEVSQFILNYLGRSSITSRQYTDVLNGQGQQTLILRHWPVTKLLQLSVDDVAIAEAKKVSGSGFVLEPWNGFPAGYQQSLSLRGYSYSRGNSNVSITYEAGYKITGEAHTIPSGTPYTIAADISYGSFAHDAGVTYANGTALVSVAASPALGQYSVSNGVYSFSSSDAGAAVLLSYSFIPADIEHACVALVAERYRYRSRIGEISKTLGGQESTSYSQKDMPEFVRTLLQPYKRILA